jgi:hypothetical protein
MPPATELIIEARYNGPRGLGNGGYVAGALADFVVGDAEVRLQQGFPLDTPLTVARDAEGGVRCLLGDRQLGSARPLRFDLAIPPPPTLAAAAAATGRFRCIHFSDPRGCYVCSPQRAPGDGLRAFCGPLGAGREPIVAGVWVPDAALADADGCIAPRLVWAALDCPGGYAIAALAPDAGRQLLGTCAATLRRPLRAGARYILSSWQVAPPEGRKRFMGVAIHDTQGALCAAARQIWIAVAAPADAAETIDTNAAEENHHG